MMCSNLNTHKISYCLSFTFLMFSYFLVGQTTIDVPEVDLVNAACDNTLDYVFDFSGDEFNPGNNFIIELSDAEGSFENPVEVDFLIGNGPDGNLNRQFFDIEGAFNIPKNLEGGENYAIRVRSTDPEVISDPSESFPAYYVPQMLYDLNNDDDVSLCNGAPREISFQAFLLETDIGKTAEDYSYAVFKDGIIIDIVDGTSFTASEIGSYQVSVYVGPICTLGISRSNPIQVGVFNVEAVQIQGENLVEICAEESYDLVASIDNNSLIYKWYKDDEQITGLADYQPTLTASGTNPFGVYRLDLETQDGCLSSSQDVTIAPREGADFTISINSDTNTRTLLPSETIELEVSVDPTSSQLSYRWYKDGQATANVTPNIQIVSSGEYYVEVIDNTSICPFPVESELITVLDAVGLRPVIQTDSNYVSCNVEQVQLSVEQIYIQTEDGQEYEATESQLQLFTYQWYKNTEPINNAIIDLYNVNSYEDNDQYTLYISNGGGVNIVEAFAMPVDVLLSIDTQITSSSDSNNLCPGSSIDLTIDVVDSYTYTWFKDDVALAISDVSVLNATETGVYYVTYEGFGCSKTSNVVELLEFDSSTLATTPSTQAVLIPGESAIITAEGADSYEWLDPDGSLVSTSSELEAITIGTYTLVGFIDDCSVEKEIAVVESDGNVIVPNIISPFNNDGANDTWKIPNELSFQPTVSVFVYNSRGDEVFSTEDYQNNWPEDVNGLRGGMIFYYKILKENTLIKAGTISVLD